MDALAWCRARARLADRRRLRVGIIRRVTGGYAYSAPQRSRTTVHDSVPPVVRFRLEPDDVATYIVHPRTGERRVDRLNESTTSQERRLVDGVDPRHRPIFVLTPSGRVVRYDRDRAPLVLVGL